MSDPTATAALRCPSCGSEAYLCDRPEHGAATWAFHCRSKSHHNKFGARGTQPPPSWGYDSARTGDVTESARSGSEVDHPTVAGETVTHHNSAATRGCLLHDGEPYPCPRCERDYRESMRRMARFAELRQAARDCLDAGITRERIVQEVQMVQQRKHDGVGPCGVPYCDGACAQGELT